MNGKILVVDDEERVRKILGIQLRQAGYDVEIYSDPKQAINAITDDDIDLVITDIRMPGITGEDILTHTKNFRSDVPVIVLTGVVDVEMAVRFLRRGAFDYLLKPVKRQELLLTVERALDHYELLVEKKRLELENIQYQRSLEQKVEERTVALRKALENLEKIHMDTVEVLASTIEVKEMYSKGHSERVRKWASRLAIAWGFSADQVKRLEFGALLHDIGKIAVPETILNKPAKLTYEEFEVIKQHPVTGSNIVSQVDYFQDIAPIIRWHHEFFDGSGYPDGLEGQLIPIQARMIAVVDAFDAMTSDRPYRKRMEPEVAARILREGKGRQFDPELVDLFLSHKIHLDTWCR